MHSFICKYQQFDYAQLTYVQPRAESLFRQRLYFLDAIKHYV